MKRLPEWFKQTGGKKNATTALSKLLQRDVPNSICQEAKCPNRVDCFNKGVLTFMILGTTCTRNCGFCSVVHGKPKAPDLNELETLIHSVRQLDLKFVVLTSPNRDDLKDGGASHYAHIVRGLKKEFPALKVEVLIPDFQGNVDSLKVVLDANPDVLNHNIETVPSLYTKVRKGSLYKRSLDVLSHAKTIAPHILTKSGVMVGLGETLSELIDTFQEIRNAKVDILTVGQYLKPDKQNLEVIRYYHPDEFLFLKKEAEKMAYKFVFSGPLVRSSYLAEHIFDEAHADVFAI